MVYEKYCLILGSPVLRDPQSVVLGRASPECLLEIQVLSFHPRPTKSKTGDGA